MVIRAAQYEEHQKMTAIRLDHDYEACIVAVEVNGVTKGTGFFIAPDVIVTCAHVLYGKDPKNESPTPQDKFSVRCLVNEDRQIAANVDRERFPKTRDHDVAFLKLVDVAPDTARIARISQDETLVDREVHSKGYAITHPFKCQPAKGKIIGTSHGDGTGRHITLDGANNFKKGHSGAPLFEKGSGLVIGMARSISPDAQNSRQPEMAYVIPISVIRSLWPELFTEAEAREQVHRTAESRLSQELELILQKDERLLVDLAKQFGFSGKIPESRERIPEIVKKLLKNELNDAVQQLVSLEKKYLKAGESESVRSVSGVFHAVMGAILDPELVRMLRSRVAAGEFLLLVPASTRTVAALLMAGVDGRLGRFRPTVGTVRTPPSGTLEVLPPAERGIERDGRFDRESLQSALTDTFRISLPDMEDPEDVLLRMLRSSAKDHERLYLVDGLGKAKLSEETRSAITKTFPYLYIIDLQTPDADRKEKHNDVFAKIMLGCFLT